MNLDTFFQASGKSEVLLRQMVSDLAFWNMQQMAQLRLEKMGQLQLTLDLKVTEVNQLERICSSCLSRNKKLTFILNEQNLLFKRIFDSRTWRIMRFFGRNFREITRKIE